MKITIDIDNGTSHKAEFEIPPMPIREVIEGPAWDMIRERLLVDLEDFEKQVG